MLPKLITSRFFFIVVAIFTIIWLTVIMIPWLWLWPLDRWKKWRSGKQEIGR